MFKLIKKILGLKETEKDYSYLYNDNFPPITIKVPMPKVKTFEPNIKEPVLAFVNLYRKYPKRFKITREVIGESSFPTQHYRVSLTDSVTGEVFVVTYSETIRGDFCCSISENTEFLSEEEIKHIYNSIKWFNVERFNRLKSILATKQRNRLMKIYGGE